MPELNYAHLVFYSFCSKTNLMKSSLAETIITMSLKSYAFLRHKFTAHNPKNVISGHKPLRFSKHKPSKKT